MSIILITGKARFTSEILANPNLYYEEGDSPEDVAQKTEKLKNLGSVISVDHPISGLNQLDVTQSESAQPTQIYTENPRASQAMLEATRKMLERVQRQQLNRKNARKKNKSRKNHRKK